MKGWQTVHKLNFRIARQVQHVAVYLEIAQ